MTSPLRGSWLKRKVGLVKTGFGLIFASILFDLLWFGALGDRFAHIMEFVTGGCISFLLKAVPSKKLGNQSFKDINKVPKTPHLTPPSPFQYPPTIPTHPAPSTATHFATTQNPHPHLTWECPSICQPHRKGLGYAQPGMGTAWFWHGWANRTLVSSACGIQGAVSCDGI